MRSTYARGWRPAIPAIIQSGCPELAILISEMWELDFRIRPSLRDVVPRIEALSETAALDHVHQTAAASERSGLEDALADSHLSTISELKAKHDLHEANTAATIARLEAENASLVIENTSLKVNAFR